MDLHVRFEHDEALAGKKEFLCSQINLLELLGKLKEYRSTRKQELILKSRLKNGLSSVRAKIVEIGEHLPKETQEEIRTIKRIKHEEKAGRSVESQLQEIKNKLAALQ